jgi:hypothetical protein
MTNLSTESKAELQRMIDIGAKQMRAQGCCSMNRDHTTCSYRGANGSKCFIGALIADEHYSNGLEGFTVRSEDDSGGRVLQAVESSGYKLTLELLLPLHTAQTDLHDDLEHSKDFPASFEAALVSYCSDYGLDYTVPGEDV